MDNPTTTGETWAQVLIRGGSQAVSQPALQEFDQFEQARQALVDNPQFSADYKREEAAKLEDDIDRRLRTIEAGELAAELKALDQEEGKLAAALKGNQASAESQDPAAQTWALRQDLAITLDLTLARELTDPEALADLFAESLASERVERIRRVCPIVVQRLQAMAVGSIDERLRALTRTAMSEYAAWTSRHPSLASQHRSIPARRERLPIVVRERHQAMRTKLHFRQ
jgi:hypothetical protein